MLLICKTVRAIRNFSIVFRNILIGVCMAALDPMFHLKNLQLEEVYSLYARRKYPGNLVIKKKSYYPKNFRSHDTANTEIS